MTKALLQLIEEMGAIKTNTSSISIKEKIAIIELVCQIKSFIHLEDQEILEALLNLLQNRPAEFSEPIDMTNPIHLAYHRIAYYIDTNHVNSLLMPNVKAEDSYGNQLDNLLPGQFILSDDGVSFIDLESFFNSAFIRIRNGEKKFFQYINADNQICDLSANEKQKLSSLLPSTLEFFYLADNVLNASKNTVLELFEDLRAALLAGDVKHNGQETDAGSDANIGLVNFKTKYDLLPPHEREELENLKTPNEKTLKSIFVNLFKTIEEAKQSNNNLGVRYCLSIIGGELQSFIAHNITKLRQSFYDASLVWLENCANEIKKLQEAPHFRLFALNQTMATKFLCQENPFLLEKQNLEGKTIVELVLSSGQLSALPIDSLNKINNQHILNFITENNFKAVKTLLDFNPNFFQDDFGMSALRHAIILKRHAITKLLAKANINPLFLDNSLELAIEQDNLEIVNTLIKEGVNVSRATFDAAMTKKNAPIFALLFTHSPQFINEKDASGETFLDKAIAEEWAEGVEALLENNATITYDHVAKLAFEENFELLQLLIGYNPECLDYRDQFNRTLLLNLLNNDTLDDSKLKIIYFLIENDVDVNEVSDDNVTPLELALNKHHYLACEALCKANIKINPNHLVTAIKENNSSVLDKLLKSYGFVNTKTNDGVSLLELAVKENMFACAETLIEHGASIYYSHDGFYPIDHALKNHANDMLILLLKSGSPAPTLSIAEHIPYLSNEAITLLKFVLSTGKNTLPAMFKQQGDSILQVLGLIKEITKLKSFIHNQFDHRPDSSVKKNLLFAELRKLDNCATFKKFNNIVNDIRKIMQTHSKTGVAGLISFNWMRGLDGYKNFSEQYGKTNDATDSFTKRRAFGYK